MDNIRAASGPSRPRLLRASEVDRDCLPDSALHRVLEWLREFIVAPHPELGRKGPVCPFAPVSLELDYIWMAEVTEADPSMQSISAIITEYRDVFLAAEPASGPNAIYKSFLVVFPSLDEKGPEGAAFVDKVQASLKKYFVDMGLMLGEFHATNESPGLRNPEFRPLRSPIPILAIRHMVDSDLPFLVRMNYTATQRSSFLRSYFSRLSTTLSPPLFARALDCLISAEIEIWLDKAKAGNAPALHGMLPAKSDAERQSVSVSP
jgi:hypothetical protein